MNYYNEFDPNAAAWLRGLITEGLIPAGEVDERSITDVLPTELSRYTQCHFFAGIGGWSLALRLAGWPDDRPVWTGSCPCQPFSSAGKGLGRKDPRHLWPAFRRLINRCRPPVVFGEQVASADGRKWLAGVFSNLETMGYSPAGLDLCAAGIGAPHIRQRLWWVGERLADASDLRRAQQWEEPRQRTGGSAEPPSECEGFGHGLGDSHSLENHPSVPGQQVPAAGCHVPAGHGRSGGGDSAVCSGVDAIGLGNTHDAGSQGHHRDGDHRHQPGRDGAEPTGSTGSAGRLAGGMGQSDMHGCQPGDCSTSIARHGDSTQPTNFWSDSRLILCRDGKHRRIPTQPGLFPLADGLPYKLARRGSVRPALLKGAGNAIVPELAAEFISAFLETKGGQ